jgi:hypothetical protein
MVGFSISLLSDDLQNDDDDDDPRIKLRMVDLPDEDAPTKRKIALLLLLSLLSNDNVTFCIAYSRRGILDVRIFHKDGAGYDNDTFLSVI